MVSRFNEDHAECVPYRYRRVNVLNISFFDEDFACFQTEPLDLFFRDWLALHELLNLSVIFSYIR